MLEKNDRKEFSYSLIHPHPGMGPGAVKRHSAPVHSAPDYIQLYPTLRCNFSCGFCFNNGLSAVEDMTFEDFRQTTAFLKPLGTRTIDIMGGEPSLHPDMVMFIEYALRNKMKVNISSNGSDLSFVAKLHERFPDMMIGISVNDRRTLKRISGTVRNRQLAVKTVVGREFDHVLINELLSLAPIMVNLIYRDVLDPAQLGETMPFDRFWKTIRDTFDTLRLGAVSCSGFVPDVSAYPVLMNTRCPAGTTKLGIMPDGSVFPCNLFFGFPEFRLGNILTTSFNEIWEHRVLTFFRTFKENNCPRRDCLLHDECHGGCPAHSYAHYGTLSAPDPRCIRDQDLNPRALNSDRSLTK